MRRLGVGLARHRAALGLLFVRARDDLVDSQQHRGRLDRRLDRLLFDHKRLPHAQLRHVREHALLAVDAPGGVAAARVLGAQLREHPDDVGTAVLEQRARDDLERSASGAVRAGDHGLLRLAPLDELVRQGHLRGAAARHDARVLVVTGMWHGEWVYW